MSLPSKPAFLLINMDSSQDRLRACELQFNAKNITYTRVSAVDGRALSQVELDAFLADDFTGYYKALTAAELGCYLSHRKCWQHIVDHHLDYAVILEDDFLMVEDVSNIGEYVSNIEQDWDCVKLMEYPLKRKVVQSFQCKDKHLVRFNKIPARTCAYIISRSGAQKMLQLSAKVSRPVDIEFQYWWENGMQTFGLQPYPITANLELYSTIDSTHNRASTSKSVLKQITQKWQFMRYNKKHLKNLIANSKD